MSKIKLVIGREYTSRVKKKSFIILTILVPVLAGGLSVLAMWMGQEEVKHYKVLVSDEGNLCDSKIFIGQDEEPPATFYFTNEFITDSMFMEQERFEEYDVLVALSALVITNKKIGAAYRGKLSATAERWIGKKMELRLEEYFALDEGVPLDQYRRINQGYSFFVYELGKKEDCNEEEIGQAVGMGFSVLIFMFLMIYGGMVLRSILEEKTGRVVEIVVSSVKPFELMMGKIIAVGLVGLTQFFIWFLMIFIILMAIQPMFAAAIDPEAMQAGAMLDGGQIQAEVTQNCVRDAIYYFINWPLLLTLFVVYFIGGYLLYGSFFAIVGAAADTESDTQQLIIPIIMPLMFVYFVSFSIMGNPNGAVAIWGSHIPFSSPIIMLQRVGANTATIWEVIISLLILTGTFIFTTYLAGKVYRTGILMYGKKASWREIIKWLRH
jgi:ABC-2 type transport system permease protein